ncbi:hypothetical protein PI124_g16162 [Phytophthora idaei]|nr:hypothetical protein PI126_g15987 [Phytophthora idaei]KAG3238891.1 hypothetical protein PI124_g16162 [Phytophthora idaei]
MFGCAYTCPTWFIDREATAAESTREQRFGRKKGGMTPLFAIFEKGMNELVKLRKPEGGFVILEYKNGLPYRQKCCRALWSHAVDKYNTKVLRYMYW